MNGVVEKADANFVGGMSFDKIGDTCITIGPYPQILSDIDTLVAAGVTAVLNVQTEIDHTHRGINWKKMTDHYY